MGSTRPPAPLTARLLAAGMLVAGALGGGLVGAAGAQGAAPGAGTGGAPDAVRAVAPERLLLQHSFPLAGHPLIVVVSGLPPRADVLLKLADPADAPLSVTRHLTNPDAPGFKGTTLAEPGFLNTLWQADDLGRVVLTIPLTDAGDADHPITLQAVKPGRLASEVLHLQVQPPTLILPAQDGLARISLQDGTLLLPALPAEGGLRGAALSPDGVLGYVLREGGLLEVRGTHQWAALPLSRRVLDPATDTLAGSAEAGVAFALVRPAGAPFTPGGELVFLGDDEHRAPVLLEPMGQTVAGRRAVVSADGLSAFVAEDDLIVREVDLLSGAARALISVGMAGDGAITDLLLDGRRLLVATRGPLGRRGSLTVFDLDTGVLSTHWLDVDPLRLVALGPGRVVVVPASGPTFQLLEDALPTRRVTTGAGRWLDAVPSAGGALLLRELPGGERALDRFDPLTGVLTSVPAGGPAGGVPAVTRLVGGETGAVVLLGDPSGAVHVLRPGSDSVALLAGVTALLSGTFVVLP